MHPVALVTGGAVRVGGAISRALADAGYRLVVNYQSSAAAAEELRDSLLASWSDVTTGQADGRPFADMLGRKPDLTKIKGLIGYQPRYSLEQTLEQIIEFERAQL